MPMKPASSPILLFILIGTTRLFGLLRSLILANIWGSGEEAAAFELAQNLSTFLYDTLISTVLSAMFIPAYVQKQDAASRDCFISTLILPIFAIGAILYLPLILFPKGTLSLAACGISPSLLIKTAPTLSVLSLGRVTLSLSCLFVGVLQSEGAELKAALYYCVSSGVSMLTAAVLPQFLTAFTLSALLALLDIALLFALSRSILRRHSVSITVARRFSLTRPMLLRAFWVILSGIFLPLLTLLSSLTSAGIAGSEGISLIGYAAKLVLLGAALLTSVTHAAYYAAMARSSEPMKTLKRILLRLLVLSALATIALLLFARPIVNLLYKRSALSEGELHTLVLLLSLYAPSIVALTLSSLLSDFAYLRNQTAHIALGNIAAILLTAFFFSLAEAPTLPFVPLYFTVSAYLRLVFTAFTVFSKPDREHPRLLLVLSDRNIGGAGRWLLTYLRSADRERFDIHVALPENAALTKEVKALGYPCHTLGCERSFSFRNTLIALGLMLKLRPDLVNTSASLSARIAAFITRVPVRLYTRHCVYRPSPLFASKTLRFLNRQLSRLLTPNAIAVAHNAKDNLVSMGLDPKRIQVIANGVFPIERKEEKATILKRQLGIDNEPIAVICARLEKDKSVDTLIEAIAYLKNEGEPYHALIVGEGSEKATLTALADSLDVSDRVHFCGFVSDVSPYLSAADCYINCSVGSEATSLAIAEAMSLSLPIVATDYGGNPHMVKDGDCGILIRQKNARELADALLILSDPAIRQRFGRSAQKRYLANYRADTMAKRYEALYRTLLHQKGYRNL